MEKMKKIVLFLLLTLTVQYSYSQWEQVYSGISYGYITSFASDGTKIVAGTTESGMLLSKDYGGSFNKILSEILVSGHEIRTVWSVAISGDSVFAGANLGSAGLFLSTNLGETWQTKNIGLMKDYSLYVIGVKDDHIFVGTGSCCFYVSTDRGELWKAKNIKVPGQTYSPCILSMSINNNDIALGISTSDVNPYGVFLSTDMGDTWEVKDYVMSSITLITIHGDTVIAFGGPLYISTDKGNSWKISYIEMGSDPLHIQSIVVIGSTIIAGNNRGEIFLSRDMGGSWITKNRLPNSLNVYSLFISGDYIFAGTYGECIYRAHISDLLDIQDPPAPLDFISLSPNPATDNLNIKIPSSSAMIGAANYSILNLLGQTVQSGTLGEIGSEGRISVASLPSGMYFLILMDRHTGTYVPLKFVKE